MNTFYHKNKEIFLKKQSNIMKMAKKRLWVQAKNRYRELSNKEKNIKREYGRNRSQNMSEKDKQRLKNHQRNYHKAKKLVLVVFFFT